MGKYLENMTTFLLVNNITLSDTHVSSKCFSSLSEGL